MYGYFKAKGELDDTEFIPIQYGDTLPDVTGASVYILDYSVDPETLISMSSVSNTAQKFVMLDHHESAINKYVDYFGIVKEDRIIISKDNYFILFDQNKSGCGLTRELVCEIIFAPGWSQYRFNASKNLDLFIDHIQDRDLWLFKLPQTQAYYELLNSLELKTPKDCYEFIMDFTDDELASSLEQFQARVDMRMELALEYASKASTIIFENHVIKAVNVPANFSSIVGDILNKDVPFALMYVTDGVNVFCSLRSDKDTGVDVSKIAIKYGGGGHRASSGFRMNLEDFSKMMSVARLPKDKQ
jgi:nanoRNase/pAp phosphatase (c-di-AMP/oligoRNAs hydrolase)